MKKIFLLLIVFLVYQYAGAQQATADFSIQVKGSQGAAVENATVALLKSDGKQLLKASLTDKTGTASFEKITTGEYTLSISALGFEEYRMEHFVVTENNAVKNIELRSKDATKLNEVTVTARKPFIQRLNDRIVVNVENSVVNAGSSAFEVLERSPGVTIDPNDNIALRGKQGVIIMIDGKPSPMTGTDLVNYLRGMTSSNIERIDIITNPSSKYDAAGNAGIIDIRLKKDQRMGTNGTFTAGYGQGVYPKANAGLSLNHRNKKLNIFGSYNFGYRKNLNHLYLDRNFYEDGVFTGSDLKDNFTRAPFTSNSFRLGADYFASKKTIIGFVLNSNLNGYSRKNNNSSQVMDENHDPSFDFNTLATNKDKANNFVGNINLKHTFKPGQEITTDVDHGRYNSRSNSNTTTQYYKIGGGSLQPDYILDGKQRGKLTLTTAKVDYVNPLKNKATLEAGIKTSFVSADNDAKFYDASSGTPVVDAGKTNHFLYDENNNAAYINYKQDFKKWDLQVGLRAEQTNIKTYQEVGKVKWDSNYIQFFPTAYFNYKIKEDQTLGVSVSRRIDRPGYSQLNPFLFLIDVTTYSTGNPGLLPQFTWAYELNYTVKNINLSLNYSRTTKAQNIVIARYNDLFPQNPQGDNVTVQIPVNLSSSDYYGLSVSAPLKITKWWNMINNADVYYNHFNGTLGSTKLSKGKPAADIRTTNSFSLKKGWSAELGGVFSSGGQYGFMVTKPQWGLNAGVQKMILQNKGTLKFNVTDIFWTNLPRATITYDNYIEKWHAQRETRVANISFSYRFGKKTVQGARRRTTGSEEERQRAGN
ncbi:MAG: TonB-dependent receptor [Ferruginibacter sp.]